MKNLILIRHAATHPQHVFESDKDRLLTQIGFHQIESIVKQLKEKKSLQDYLYSPQLDFWQGGTKTKQPECVNLHEDCELSGKTNKNLSAKRILCSPAKRAVQTAQLLCKKLEINPKLINLSPILYSGDTEAILKSISSQNLSNHVFIIGHNPTLSCLAHKLCPSTNSIILPTAGVISLSFDIINWDDLLTQQGKLLFFIEPKHE